MPANSESAGSRRRYWATELPLLHPGMLISKRGRLSAFPFNEPMVEYVHFARNAIYALAKQFRLEGADVLLPAYFHGVELEALLAAGVRPRFFPVHAGMQVEPEDVRKLVRANTRAIYLIHYIGFPGPAEALREICDERGLLLIEDCALSLLSRRGDKWLGTQGDAAIFCIYKTLPTPDGGAAVVKHDRLRIDGVMPPRLGTTRETVAALLLGFESGGSGVAPVVARSTRALARPFSRPTRTSWVHVGTQHFQKADATLLMSNVSRRILAAQDFDSIVRARRRNYLHLQELLGDVAPPVFRELQQGVCPLFYPLVTQHKRLLWEKLRTQGIQAVLFWMTNELGPAAGEFREVDTLRQTVLEIPCHQDLTAERIARMASIVRAALRDLPV